MTNTTYHDSLRAFLMEEIDHKNFVSTVLFMQNGSLHNCNVTTQSNRYGTLLQFEELIMASSSLSWKSEVPAAIELLVLFHLGLECADLQSEASKTCSVPSLSHNEASCKLTITTSLFMKEKIISPSWLPKMCYERERVRLYPWKTIIIRSSFSSFFWRSGAHSVACK